MGDKSAIEWTDATWNPVRGCSRVSPGCEHCYAEGVAARFSGPGQPYEGLARRAPNGEPRWTGTVRLVPEQLDQPLRWKKPRRIFVNSMSDLFHESLPDDAIDQVFAVMALAPHHTFQVLTKRAERMREYISRPAVPGVDVWGRHVHDAARRIANLACERLGGLYDAHHRGRVGDFGINCDAAPRLLWPLRNVWLGVSVENQEAADERVPLLLQTPAAVRFLSIEPLLGPVDLTRLRAPTMHRKCCGETCDECGEVVTYDALNATAHCACCVEGDEAIAWNPLHWVIVGGESGTHARPMHPQWARDLRDQCVAAGVPFFFKQFGEHLHEDVAYERDLPIIASGPPADGSEFYRVGKKRAGRELDGRTWDELPA